MKFLKTLLIVSSVFVCASCTFFQTSDNTADNKDKGLESDKILETQGTITPRGISLFGGGTHYLTDSDGDIIYSLESKEFSLSQYEKKEVKIKGELKENTADEDYELISVITIEIVNDGAQEIQTIDLAKKGFSVELPGDWEYIINAGTWEFFPKDGKVVITIEDFDATSESGEAAIEDMVFIFYVSKVTVLRF